MSYRLLSQKLCILKIPL